MLFAIGFDICLITTYLALDQIITQIMENTNSHAPVPATEEVMKGLPRNVLEYGCEYIKIGFTCET